MITIYWLSVWGVVLGCGVPAFALLLDGTVSFLRSSYLLIGIVSTIVFFTI